jgi:phosphate starvation-inducible membrane PsiE
MKNILIALLIGISAAIIDVVPMMIQRIDKYACISAFIQWMVLGLIIPYINWDMQPWLKGLIIAELTALPIMVLVFAKEPKSVIPIIIFSAILGSAVGFAGAKFIKQAYYP